MVLVAVDEPCEATSGCAAAVEPGGKDQKIASKLAPTEPLESIIFFVFDRSCRPVYDAALSRSKQGTVVADEVRRLRSAACSRETIHLGILGYISIAAATAT